MVHILISQTNYLPSEEHDLSIGIKHVVLGDYRLIQDIYWLQRILADRVFSVACGFITKILKMNK